MDNSYLPVSYDFREILDEERLNGKSGKIFFFNQQQLLDSVEGTILDIVEIAGSGVFVTMDSGDRVRLDRIITLFGRPGPAFDEYDSYGNQCLACTGGYDL